MVDAAGSVVKWLLGFIDEDHIGDWTWVFSRQVLEDQLVKAGDYFIQRPRFTDGDGDYTLTVRVQRSA